MSTRSNQGGIQALAGCAFIGVLCLLCGGCGIGMMNGGIEFSDGYREGTIQKFSHKGIAWKTHEGELAMAGFKQRGDKDNPTMSNVFAFTVTDPEVVKQLENIHATETVRLHYKQYLCVPPWRGDTQYFIWKVEKLQ